MTDEAAGYFIVRYAEDGQRPLGYMVSADRVAIDAWREQPPKGSGQPPNQKSADEAAMTSIAETGAEKEVVQLLLRFRDTMASMRSVIALVSLAGPLMRWGTIQTSLVPFAKANLNVMEDGNEFKLFSFSRAQFGGLLRELKKYHEVDIGFHGLPSAVILSLVATFDSHFVDIVKKFLSLYPQRYQNSTKEIRLEDVLKASSISELIENVADEELSTIMRGSHLDQIRFVEDNLSIKIVEQYDRWGDFIEIFERRNLAAHGNLVVNETYLTNCASAKCEHAKERSKGEILTVDGAYLYSAVDNLTEFGVMLLMVLWIKHQPKSKELAMTQLNEFCYELIRGSRFSLAIRLLHFGMNLRKPVASDMVVKMMIMNLANAYKKNGESAQAEKILADTDWSAANDGFNLCLASLRGDIAKVLHLMPRVFASGEVSAVSFRDWPVLDWVRSDPAVIELFSKVYGEPLQKIVEPDAPGVQNAEGPSLTPATTAAKTLN